MNLKVTGALKKKLRTRELVFGSWTSLGHPEITEIFCNMGLDFMGIDLEHTTISLEQSQRIISSCQAMGVACLPRIGSHTMETIKRLLDSGGDGIIAPLVNTSAQATELGKYIQFPPLGERSFGVARAQNYGLNFDEYMANWNECGTFIAQIESIQGVQNIESIITNPAVDGAMIGPYDMSGSMGIAGQIEHPRVLEACAQVISACKRAGKACGIHLPHPTQESVEAKIKAGFTFIVLGSDIFLMAQWTKNMQGIIRNLR